MEVLFNAKYSGVQNSTEIFVIYKTWNFAKMRLHRIKNNKRKIYMVISKRQEENN